MVKITFEISEEYIREHADVDNVTTSFKDNVMMGMLNLLAFGGMEQELKNGKTEFVVKREAVDDRIVEMYDHGVAYACLLATKAAQKEKKAEQSDAPIGEAKEKAE